MVSKHSQHNSREQEIRENFPNAVAQIFKKGEILKLTAVILRQLITLLQIQRNADNYM
jgi:hypothetical protein